MGQAFARMPHAHLPGEVLEVFLPVCSAAVARGLEAKKKKRLKTGGSMMLRGAAVRKPVGSVSTASQMGQLG